MSRFCPGRGRWVDALVHGEMAQINASFSGEGTGSQINAGSNRGYARLLGKVDLSREWLVMGSNSPVGVRGERHRFKPNVRPRSRTPSQQRVVSFIGISLFSAWPLNQNADFIDAS